MKNKSIILILLCMVFASCGEDRRLEYIDQTAYDRWMDNTMIDHYLWYNEMTEPKQINYFIAPEEFLKSRRAKQDNDYSYIENPNNNQSKLGHGLRLDKQVLYDDTAYAIRVLYVESDSPGKDAQLKRGDWIIKINGEYIVKNKLDIIDKGEALELTLGERIANEDENGRIIYKFNDLNRVTLPAARATADKPIHYHQTYTLGNGSRVGYLSYNNYASGVNENDDTYDNELRTVSNTFKAAGISDFILDLRYNPGGSFESMQLLATLLAPQEALGETMCHLVYNDKHPEKNETVLFSNEMLNGGSNLNLPRLFIISGTTTGTLSDILINSLMAYIPNNIILVGQNTKGNHTLTHPYIDEGLPYVENENYILHLVDCMALNARNEVPDGAYVPGKGLTLNELENVENHLIRPLGDPKEYLLATTLYLIEHGTLPEKE